MNQPVVVQVVERVPIEQALSVGWEGMKHKFLMILGVLMISGFFASVPSLAIFFGADMISRHLLLCILLMIYQIVVSAVVWLGIIKMSLHVNREQPFTVDDFLAVGAQLPSFFAVFVFRGILVVIGYLCFIIPGIFLHVKFDQADYFIVDRKMGPLSALEASWRVTSGAVLMLWLFGIITGFVQFIGWCALVIGALPAHMVVLLAKARVYDNLVATSQDATLIGKLAFSGPISAAEPGAVILAPGTDSPALSSDSTPTPTTPSPTENPLSPSENQALDSAAPAQSPSETAPAGQAAETSSQTTTTGQTAETPSETASAGQAAETVSESSSTGQIDVAPPPVPPNIATES